ncbi:MAG: AmmeMemoRadiSam system protein B [Candidatus Omnitrophota bacterium]
MWKTANLAVFFIVSGFALVHMELDAEVKHSDLSGTWYNASRDVLEQELSGYLSEAEIEKPKGTIISVIAPHAGFSYSGKVAAYAFNAIRLKSPRTLIIVGFTHRKSYPDSVSVFTGSAFETPLGKALINKDVAQKLISFDPRIKDIPEAFDTENSVEMLVPFAQTALPETRIVLVAICDQGMGTSDVLAKALYEIMSEDESVMVVASTDMSHFLTHDEALKKDAFTINLLRTMDPEGFYRQSFKGNHQLMCGQGPVYAVMKASQMLGADGFSVLKYATSADVSGDRSRVVGYLSAVFFAAVDNIISGKFERKEKEKKMFNLDQKRTLLEIARNAINYYLKTGRKPEVVVDDDNLNLELGGFVTLHKSGSLRGCIGRMQGEGPFYRTVTDMSVAAAVEDPRFPKVRQEEMEDIDIEISALSPMQKIDDPSLIEMGKHGVMVRMGRRSGVYLPQVADETGWSRDEFMDSLCEQKAGIPKDAWKTGDADIYIYTAEVFGEKDILQESDH